MERNVHASLIKLPICSPWGIAIEPYLFCGVVRPERAALTLQFQIRFSHSLCADNTAKVEILLNQIAVWIQSPHAWNVYDLRNVVTNIVRGELSVIGYLEGHAYDFEITRVLSPERQIDFVFGVDTSCISQRARSITNVEMAAKIRDRSTGPYGMFLRRCFVDLVSSMKDADDTGFYCYRAIESLRHHCAALNGLRDAGKPAQWEKLREVSGADEPTLRAVMDAAAGLRHGEGTHCTSEERQHLLTTTWTVVDGYLTAL